MTSAHSSHDAPYSRWSSESSHRDLSRKNAAMTTPPGAAPDRTGSDEHADDDEEEDRGVHRLPDDGIDAGGAKARAGDRDGARRECFAECA